MAFDGELRGKPGLIKSIAYRTDYLARTTSEIGRAWENVTVYLSDCDPSKASATFSLNSTSTPTRVFSGTAAWPTLNGDPGSRPAPWGAASGGLQFPFARAWGYAGTKDICLDYKFGGGTLVNGGSWSSLVPPVYYLDGFSTPPHTMSFGAETRHGKSLGNGGCMATGSIYGMAGFASMITQTNSSAATSNPGQFLLSLITVFTETKRAVIHAVGFGGSAAGVVFPGVTCNRLYINPSQPTLFVSNIASPPYRLTSLTLGPTNYLPARVGVPIWFQAAWADSVSGALLLTNASQNAVSKTPQVRTRAAVYTSMPTNATGAGPFIDTWYNPVCRFTR